MGSSIGTIWMYGTPRVDWYSPTADLKAITADSYVDANNNVPIASSFTLPPFKLESYDVQMYIDKIVPYVRNAGNLELTARILDNQSEALTEWFPIATLSKYQQEFSAKQIQGTLLQVRGSEIGKNTAWEFYGVEVLLSKSSDLKD